MRTSARPYAVRTSSVGAPYRSAVPRSFVSRTYESRSYHTRPYVGSTFAQRRHGGVSRGRYSRPHSRSYYRPSVRYYPRYYPRSSFHVGLGFGYPFGYWANPYYGSLFYPSWYGPWGGYGGFYPHGPYYGRPEWSEYAEDQGGIRLQVQPKNATVFVDGYFVGEVNDFDGGSQRLTLDAGVHKIEIRAPGFETLAIDINILRRETIRYRGAMRPLQP